MEQFQFSVESNSDFDELDSPPNKKSKAGAAVYQSTLIVYILMIFIHNYYEY